MSYKKERKISNTEPQKKWFWFLIGIFFFCLFSYGYLVRGTIVNIVYRQGIEEKLSSLNSIVTNLESEYIIAKNSVTLEKAYELGYIYTANQKFVTRTINSPSLSLLTPGY